ncbi:MAG TPA: PH domain-containing protein [Candidatus Nanopelagicales bacterium]
MADPELTVEDAFAPPGEPWRPVSPKLATARRLTLALVMVPLLLLFLAVAALVPEARLVVALLVVGWAVVAVWLTWLIGRRVRSFGYAERADDLLVTSGIMFRRLVVVPYGRMQLVDITAGPIDRMLGVATVQLHTAAASTNATIPGLPPDEAAGLRDRLAARGELRSAGL